MALNNDDLFLVNQGGVSKKITYQNLKTNLVADEALWELDGTNIQPVEDDHDLIINGDVQMESQNGGPLAGFRNHIINGGMAINQRHGLNNVQTLQNGFAVDRWRCTDGTNYSQQSSTNNWADGFDNHILINTSGNATIYQHIELDRPGVPSPFAVGTTWTLSAYVAGNQATFNVQPWVVFTDGANGTGNQTNVFNPGPTSVTHTNAALERVSWTFTVAANPAATNTSLTVFLIGSNLGGSLSISGVQLEPGPVATPFEHRPIGTELALCERYYQVYGPFFGWIFHNQQTTKAFGGIPLRTIMRAAPSQDSIAAFDAPETRYYSGQTADRTLTAMAMNIAADDFVQLVLTGVDFPVGSAGHLDINLDKAFTLSAEL